MIFRKKRTTATIMWDDRRGARKSVSKTIVSSASKVIIKFRVEGCEFSVKVER